LYTVDTVERFYYNERVGSSEPDARQPEGAEPMTTATREQISELRDAIADISDELSSKQEEARELLAEIAALKEGKKWRVEAIRFLKAGGEK
jgi:chromosome segregation ATPase